MLCAKCGTDNPEGTDFCARCGTRMTPPVADQPVSASSPPVVAQKVQPSAESEGGGISGLLYFAAVVALAMGIAAAIVVMTSDVAKEFDGSQKATYSLMLLRYGVFATGIIAGVAGLIQSYKSRETGGEGAIVGFLQFWAFLSLVVAVAIAGLNVKDIGDSYSGYGGGPDAHDKALVCIPYLLQGLFFAGVMIGMARWISSLRRDEEVTGGGFLYLLAFFTFCLGLAMASLAITGGEEDMTFFSSSIWAVSALVSMIDLALCTTEKSAMFLTIFVPTGLLCGCILAGFAAITPRRRWSDLGAKCPHCGKEISPDWKACPYCCGMLGSVTATAIKLNNP